jgi:hypothetical protein
MKIKEVKLFFHYIYIESVEREIGKNKLCSSGVEIIEIVE